VEKKSHLGKAGQLAAMAEFLLRGYNVAIPEVDVGDDIFVVDDRIGDLSRIQVKTATTLRGASYGRASAQFKLSRRQLENARPVDLTYVFVLRRFGAWSFYVVSRAALNEMRAVFEASRVARGGARAKLGGNDVQLRLTVSGEDVLGWGASFRKYLNDWSSWPELRDGPGATARAADRSTSPGTGPLFRRSRRAKAR
jgi:hypothetical protein